MTAFQVRYSVDQYKGNKLFDAANLDEAFSAVVKILHDEGISPKRMAEASINVRNLNTDERFTPNFEFDKLVPNVESPAVAH